MNRMEPPNVPSTREEGAAAPLQEVRKQDEYDADNEAIFNMDEEHAVTAELPGEDDSQFEVAEEAGEEEDDLPTGFTAADRHTTSGIRHSGRFVGARPNASARLPSSSIAASLPVTIGKGFWPPREAVDSLQDTTEEEDEFEHEGTGNRTILPQRDIYHNMQLYSRSIQPADDPERLFGERPRRRYRTGRDSSCAVEPPTTKELLFSPPQPFDADYTSTSPMRISTATAAIGLARSVVTRGMELPFGNSIPIVVRDRNAATTDANADGDGDGEEQIIVGSMSGDVGRPRIIIPASLPFIHNSEQSQQV